MIQTHDIYSNRILRMKEVITRTGLSRATIYARIRSNEFPAQVALSKYGRSVGWKKTDIDQWIESRPEAHCHSITKRGN